MTPLNTDDILAYARQKEGLEDLGDPRIIEGLRKLVETYNGEADLTEKGLERQRRRLQNLARTRLRIQRAWTEDPSLLDATISQPLYVVSLPRTGTSALFNLLAVDETNRPLLFWEGRNPDPVETAPGEPDPRFVALHEALERGRKKNPEFTAIHFTRADGPEECVTLMELAFDGAQQGMEPLMEPYGSWFRTHDFSFVYDDYRKLLSTLQSQRPGDRWLLKSPAHLWGTDQILRLFPDASIVQTHRDPARSIPSYCSMIHALMANRNHVDKHELGSRVLEYLATSVDRALAVREESDPDRFFDVYYDDFVAAPVETVRELYDHYGYAWTPELEASMRDQTRTHKKGKHGTHSYSAEEFGLTEAGIRERFSDYLDRFEV